MRLVRQDTLSLSLRRKAICQIAAYLKLQIDSSPSALMGVGDFYVELSLLEEMEQEDYEIRETRGIPDRQIGSAE